MASPLALVGVVEPVFQLFVAALPRDDPVKPLNSTAGRMVIITFWPGCKGRSQGSFKVLFS
jgi:hypothetical protein